MKMNEMNEKGDNPEVDMAFPHFDVSR